MDYDVGQRFLAVAKRHPATLGVELLLLKIAYQFECSKREHPRSFEVFLRDFSPSHARHFAPSVPQDDDGGEGQRRAALEITAQEKAQKNG